MSRSSTPRPLAAMFPFELAGRGYIVWIHPPKVIEGRRRTLVTVRRAMDAASIEEFLVPGRVRMSGRVAARYVRRYIRATK